MNAEQQIIAKRINDSIFSVGKTLLGQSLYRVVWSDNETEFRRGTFRDYLGSIFIREVVEVREVPKYNYISARWVLERWIPPELAINPELPNSRWGSYEPVYVFQDKGGKALPMNEKVVKYIISLAESNTRLTPEERLALEDEKENKEMQAYLDYLDANSVTRSLLGEMGEESKVQNLKLETEKVQ